MDKQKAINGMADIINRRINGAHFDDVSDAANGLYNEGYRLASEVRSETLNEVYAALWKIPMRSANVKGRVLNAIEKLGVENGGSLKEVIKGEFKKESAAFVQFIEGIISNLQQNADYLSGVYGGEVEE